MKSGIDNGYVKDWQTGWGAERMHYIKKHTYLKSIKSILNNNGHNIHRVKYALRYYRNHITIVSIQLLKYLAKLIFKHKFDYWVEDLFNFNREIPRDLFHRSLLVKFQNR